MNLVYDQAVLDARSAKQSLEDYLQKQRKRLACRVRSHDCHVTRFNHVYISR